MSQSNDDLNHPILNLTPQEKTAYSYLFGLADSDSLNVVTGERAVTFFEKTNVPAPVLGEIWQVADTENRGLLTKPGFIMVLRLIGWYQNGQHSPTAELAFKPAPIPKFDGITIPGLAAASPTTGGFPQGALQPQLSGQNTGQGQIRVPQLDPAKVQQYSGLFSRSGAQNGILDAVTAKSIFERAGLSNEVLGKIWGLADREQRGALDETEFIVAMHLLTCMNTRAMTALPNTLPQGLYDAAARRGQRPPSRQASGQSGAPPARQIGLSSIPRTQSPLARPPSSGIATPVQSAQTTGPHWLITPQEKGQYDRYFSTIDTSGRGVLSGEQAVQFFSDSRLPEDTLASIWDLADINSEGQLNKDEFAVAMYLIRQQRAPNAPPLPAFLPAALVPPSLRATQQSQQPAAVQQPQVSAFDNSAFAPPQPKSASEDLFGLDSSPTQAQAAPQQPALQPQGTGASATRDPFAGSQQGSTPSSPARFQQATGGTFKPFIPTSAFGASLAAQNTGGSATSSQGQQQQRGPGAPMPSATDDLLGDNDAHAEENRSIPNESTELANMSNQIGNLRTQMEATQTKKTATQADLNATSAQKKDLEQRLQQFRAQYETEVRTVKEMEQQLTESRESTKKLNQELALLEGSYQDLQTQHNTLSQQLQADQQENANLKQRISEINAETARLKPELEKMKMDARQQKGLVSINKKQLATNEAERDRLQSDKADLEQAAAEQSRSIPTSPEPVTGQASNVASPAASTMSSTNPFFRKQSLDRPASPPTASPGPTPSAFDTLFGPSSVFAPSGQTGSRSATPPATSFIGRSVPSAENAGVVGAGVVAAGAAAVGATAVADSMSSAGEPTPSATPPLTDSTKDVPLDSAEPPPPPENKQFSPTHLPIIGGALGPDGKAESDAASSTMVMPPASRAGGIETPREMASSPPPFLGASGSMPGIPGAFSSDEPESKHEEPEREIIPGAFPADAQRRPSIIAQEVASSTEPPSEVPTPAPAPEAKPADEFESAFATFGEGEKSNEAATQDDPFAPTSTSQARGYNPEFPPIQNLEPEDESDSDDEPDRGFDDSFTTASPPRNGETAAASTVVAAPSGVLDTNKDQFPPSYESSTDATQSRGLQDTTSNSFPSEFGSLLPARDDPTSPPPPATNEIRAAPPESGPSALQTELEPPSQTPTTSADVFVDASSRPTSHVEEANVPSTAPAPGTSKSVFDDFDDFNDLSEAQEHDKTGSDADFAFWRSGQDEFNPVFDSPGQSHTPTPMKPAPQESNGFGNFAPSASTSGASAFGSGSDSIQQTPQNSQHDWDEIFSGLDNSKNINTSFDDSEEIWQPPPGPPPGRAPITTNGGSSGIVAPTPQSASAVKTAAPALGRALTPGTEHDDPILKRLTGMGYARSAALNALEMYDYDINKAVDHLSGS